MAWLAGYKYRQKFTISNYASVIYDTVNVFIITKRNGTSSYSFVKLGVNGCKEDFADIRFTYGDGTTLIEYYLFSIEEDDDGFTQARFYTKFDIPTGTNDYYIYYDNPSAVSASETSESDIFIAYDGFEWGSNGTDLSSSQGGIDWDVEFVGVNSYAKIDTALHVSYTRSARLYADTKSHVSFPLDTVSPNISFYFYREAGADFHIRWGNGSNSMWLYVSGADGNLYQSDGSTSELICASAHSDWHFMELYGFNWSNKSFSISMDWENVSNNNVGMVSESDYEDSFAFYCEGSQKSSYIDRFTVKPHTNTGPDETWVVEQNPETRTTFIQPAILGLLMS